jgi:hypothetical protein
VLGRPDEYERCKTLLNRGTHPTFIGRDTVRRYADNGGLLFFQIDGLDAAVALIQPRYNCLMALNVLPVHRSKGLGAAITAYLQCNWVRAIEDKVPFFERCGYAAVGKLKQGRSLRTQIMVKQSVRELAGRLKRLNGLQTMGQTESKIESEPARPHQLKGPSGKARPKRVARRASRSARQRQPSGESGR